MVTTSRMAVNLGVLPTVRSIESGDIDLTPDGAAFAGALLEMAVEQAQTSGSRSTAALRAVARHLPLIVLRAGPQRFLVECFGSGLARLGVEDDELVGVPMEALGADAAAWADDLLRGANLVSVLRGDGAKGPFEFEVAAMPLPSEPDGTDLSLTEGFVAVALDVTDRRVTDHSARLQRAALAALRGPDARFETVSQHVPIGVFLTDPDGRLTYANPELLRILGRDMDEVLAVSSFPALLHPDDLGRALSAMGAVPDADDSRIFECRVLRPDGVATEVRVRLVTVFDSDRVPTAIVGSVADISEFVAADTKLREREERTRAILETAGEAIVSCGEDGVVVEFNAAAERMFGFDSDEVIGRMPWSELVAPPHRVVLERRFREYLAGEEATFVGDGTSEVAGVRRDGTHVPMEVALTGVRIAGRRFFTSVMRDLTERKGLELELERVSTHDDLTGLPNRVLLFGQLEAALARAGRHRTSVAVLFVDIDRFKLVTESLGHRAGDELIVQVARRLEAAVLDSAAITRFSSDQFVVYLEDIRDISEAVDVATAVVDAINDPFEVAGDEAFVGATVGIAFSSNGSGTAETLVSNADVAMSRAKDRSVTRYEVFDAEMRAKVDSQRRLEIAMRHGIERHEFELFYQPIVWLNTGEVRGVEALVRWNHPRLGFLPPGEFIPVAEDSGLIRRLGGWILEEACRQQAAWARRFADRKLMMSVNLSGAQLTQPGLVDLVARALDATGADPNMIVCELTETMLLDDVRAAGETLDALKGTGVRLALDDFGTGYSSLTYLCRFPIDIVKVDRSFVSQLGTATPDSTIVEMVVNLARTMQLDVVAEGVETERQARLLKALGCPLGQGYLYSKPATASEIEHDVLGLAPEDLIEELSALDFGADEPEALEPGGPDGADDRDALSGT